MDLLSRRDSGDVVEAVMVGVSSDPTDAEMLIPQGHAHRRNSAPPVSWSTCAAQREPDAHRREPAEGPAEQPRLAVLLGAEVVQLEGRDIVEVLVNFASERNIRHAVFGKSRLSPLRERLRGSFLLDFLHDAVGGDVHIVNTTPREAP
jgi:two-component system sensor histidine kinase KdpD